MSSRPPSACRLADSLRVLNGAHVARTGLIAGALFGNQIQVTQNGVPNYLFLQT